MADMLCNALCSVEFAAETINAGRAILIVNGNHGQEVAEILIPAALAEPLSVSWAVRHTSGFLCAAMRSTRADELNLPDMVRPSSSSADAPRFGVGVDAAVGIGTGISATDRAHTARLLADELTRPDDLVRPGHILPLRIASAGVLERRATAEASVDLCEIAGLPPIAMVATLLADDGDLLQGAALAAFVRHHDLVSIHVDDVLNHRLHHHGRVVRVSTRLAEVSAEAMSVVDFADKLTGAQHTIFVGSPVDADPSAVHVITECSHRDPREPACECRQQFEACRSLVAAEGGVIIYLRPNPVAGSRYTVDDRELLRGCITAMLSHLGLDDLRVPCPQLGTGSSAVPYLAPRLVGLTFGTADLSP
ncbi:3,4-dihydroxy-2-butanone-4-phosphate synthase [Nocardia fusca]|uniref:3,4-dihydroxy-2-butanone-4-phosphate synthase n=1 Tax=Nocardia fusca TaxID=941183 RepID=UPI0007A73971|nr:3,4-dihydroxy-2-butanone-4-phosphate synthase [Nocardia fusca]